MAITTDILRAWSQPRALIREKLAAGLREDRALATVMGASVLLFVAQWPRIAREAHFDPSVPLDARMGGALLAVVFLLPILLYVVAAISHLVARLIGGRGSWFSARLALFWAMLGISPAMLLQGLVSGFIGPGPGATIIGIAVGLAFLYIWISMLREAERG